MYYILISIIKPEFNDQKQYDGNSEAQISLKISFTNKNLKFESKSHSFTIKLIASITLAILHLCLLISDLVLYLLSLFLLVRRIITPKVFILKATSNL